MSNIQLNLVNHSNSSGHEEIVIFQKNEASNISNYDTAWLVIKNLSHGDYHPFEFPVLSEVRISTPNEKHLTPLVPATKGEAFKLEQTATGEELLKIPASSKQANQIEIENSLPQGSVNANIFKNGKLLAVQPNVQPGETATFQFKPALWISVGSGIEEGQAIDSAIISEINTEISLTDISSADIVMTGGGTGVDARPFEFRLENVVKG